MKINRLTMFVLGACLFTAVISQGILKSTRNQRPLFPLINPVVKPNPQIISDCDEELKRPSKEELNERKLTRRLGGKIDVPFLSVTRPHAANKPTVKRISLSGVTTSKKNFLRLIIRNESESNRGRRAGKTPAGAERFLMKWLLRKADCPVRHEWKDLGFCYWPRYMSIGACVNKQCSWPGGMSCVPSDPVHINLLRWHCKDSKDRGNKNAQTKSKSRRSCKWYKFSYPITTDCKCKCEKSHDKVTDI